MAEPPALASAPQPLALRLGVLGDLYFTQGLPYGFFSHAVPVLLSRDHAPELVGLSSLLAVPWGLKFLWAPYFDRVTHHRFGRRKVFLWPLLLANVVALAALGLASPSTSNLTPLLAGFFLVSLLTSTQDIATDGLALDILRPSERGLGNGIQVGAYRVGMIAGGGGVLALVDSLGYAEAFFLMAGLSLFAVFPLAFVREPRVEPPEGATAPTPSALGLLLSFVRRPDVVRIVTLLAAYKVGDALAAGMTTRFVVKAGMSTADVALSRGLVGGVASIVGAVGAGVAFRWFSRRAVLTGAVSFQSIAIFAYLWLAAAYPIDRGPAPLDLLYAASLVEHLAGGAATAALFTRMMDTCRDEARATDFTVQASLVVVIVGVCLVASGFVVGALGHAGHFAVSAALGLLGPFAVLRLVEKEPGAATPREATPSGTPV